MAKMSYQKNKTKKNDQASLVNNQPEDNENDQGECSHCHRSGGFMVSCRPCGITFHGKCLDVTAEFIDEMKLGRLVWRCLKCIAESKFRWPKGVKEKFMALPLPKENPKQWLTNLRCIFNEVQKLTLMFSSSLKTLFKKMVAFFKVGHIITPKQLSLSMRPLPLNNISTDLRSRSLNNLWTSDLMIELRSFWSNREEDPQEEIRRQGGEYGGGDMAVSGNRRILNELS